MPALETELARAFRRFIAGQDRAPGDTVPESLGNQATPVMSTADGDRAGSLQSGRTSTYSDRDDTGPAYRNAPNWFGWRRQSGIEFGPHREVYVDLGTKAGPVTLDPRRANAFLLRQSGDVTITLGATEQVADPDAPASTFLYEFKFWVLRSVGAKIAWANASVMLWSGDVLDPDGDGSQSDSLLGPATKAAWDSYTVVVIPNVATFAYFAGRQFGGVTS